MDAGDVLAYSGEISGEFNDAPESQPKPNTPSK
jgi:hypothetical protein